MIRNIVVLIASHLNVAERYETIKYALTSLHNSTRKPDHVYISCSYALSAPNVDEWSEILGSIPHTIILQEKKLLQFEHYYYLSRKVNDTDIMCFLDDDDMYHPEKIRRVYDYFSEVPAVRCTNVIKHPVYYFGMCDMALTHKCVDDIKDTRLWLDIEYCSKSMQGWLFKNWFDETEKYTGYTFEGTLEKAKGLTDLIFSASFESIRFTDEPLMYIRKEYIPHSY